MDENIRFCPKCGRARLAESTFCVGCGARLGELTATSVPAPSNSPTTSVPTASPSQPSFPIDVANRVLPAPFVPKSSRASAPSPGVGDSQTGAFPPAWPRPAAAAPSYRTEIEAQEGDPTTARWAAGAGVAMALGCVLPWVQSNGIASFSVSAVTAVGKDLTATAAVVAAVVAVVAGLAMASDEGRAAEATWRGAYIVAAIASVACVAIVLFQFMSANQSLGLLAGLVRPGVGLTVTGIAGVAGIIASVAAGGEEAISDAAPPPDAPPRVDLGAWVIAQATGYSVNPGTPITLHVEDAWVDVRAEAWSHSFPAVPEYVLVVGGCLELRSGFGQSVTLAPTGGLNVALIRSLIIHPD